MTLMIQSAFKEWNVAVNALEAGQTILLLRKGGIREQQGQFSVQHQQVLLYPTFEHQNPNLLQSEYTSSVEPVASGWHPETVRIGSWTAITEIFALETKQAESILFDLLPFLIWNEQFVRDRLKFKPHKPLYLLFLRIYKLATPHTIPYHPSYGGCRSWIELQQGIACHNSTPVLNEMAYQTQCAKIRQLLPKLLRT